MKSEPLAERKVLPGTVSVVVPPGPPRDLPGLYARWVDAGSGEITLRASHTDTRMSLITHGIDFGETLAVGQVVELTAGQLSLEIGGVSHILSSGTIRVLDTDGWTYIRFIANGEFGAGDDLISACLDGWYTDVSY